MTCEVALPLREESGVTGTVQPKTGHVMTKRGEIDLVFLIALFVHLLYTYYGGYDNGS